MRIPITRFSKHACRAVITAMSIGAFLGLALPAAQAATTPIYQNFNELAGATFGGSGIPNDPVAWSTFTHGGDTITIGLSATQRYDAPAVGNDGAGNYLAQTGVSGDGRALWNFNWYIDIAGGGTVHDYGFNLSYDFDPDPVVGVGFLSLSGIWQAGLALGDLTSATRFEASQNMTFDYLATTNIPFVFAPFGSFDPLVEGEYHFSLGVVSSDFELQQQVAMNVLTFDAPAGDPTVIPVPPAAGLILLGMVGMGLRRKYAKK